MRKKEIYLAWFVAGMILTAQNSPDKAEEMIRGIAEYVFGGNVEDAAALVEFCKDRRMQFLLEEIHYWDSPVENIVGMGWAYERALPALEDYAEKTGYVIRWKAYNEKFGLPIPEYDQAPQDFS